MLDSSAAHEPVDARSAQAHGLDPLRRAQLLLRGEGQFRERVADIDQEVTSLFVRQGSPHNERNKHRTTALVIPSWRSAPRDLADCNQASMVTRRRVDCSCEVSRTSIAARDDTVGRGISVRRSRSNACSPKPVRVASPGEEIGSSPAPSPAHRAAAQPRARDQSQPARFHPSAFRERKNQRPPRDQQHARRRRSLRLTTLPRRPHAPRPPACRPSFFSASLTKRTKQASGAYAEEWRRAAGRPRDQGRMPRADRYYRCLSLRIHEPRPLRRHPDRRRPFPCPE